MKIKRVVIFGIIVLGALIMGFGGEFMQDEYAQAIGIVLMMFGLYKTTQVWSNENYGPEEKEKEEEL